MAREAFYRWTTTTNKKGEKIHTKVRMTSTEVKQYIMKVNGWNATEYRRKYDLFKNQLRAYESYKSAQGVAVEKQSVVGVLLKEARSKELYGPTYKPSQKMQQIRSFSAYSITKGRQLAQSNEKYISSTTDKYGAYINKRFGTFDINDPSKNSGFIGSNKGAQSIVNAFVEDARQKGTKVNYAKLEKALSDYANKIHARITDEETATDSEAIPFSSETYGSDDIVDFDISTYF